MSKPLPPCVEILDMKSVAERTLRLTMAQFSVATEAELATLPTRFSVQVGNRQTRVFLEYQARAMGTSIAGLAGLILDHVVEASLRKQQP